jgi:NAD(P)-dependent dehydrogenase (short-subunit alcohol dehydrogenase family)
MFDAFGTIHILVNNAGLQRDARFVDMTLFPGFPPLRLRVPAPMIIGGKSDFRGDPQPGGEAGKRVFISRPAEHTFPAIFSVFPRLRAF